MTPYTLTRSHRKTLALYIRNGEVEVRAPLRVPKREIDCFVASKEQWIQDKLSASKEQQSKRLAFALRYGDTVRYCGRDIPVTAREGDRVGFDEECFYMPPNLDPEQIKSACIQIYRLAAKRDLTIKALHFAKQMNVTPVAVKVNGAKTRWGSCSGKKSLNFSWRLMMAEEDVINYVVVHELAHIREMNHSGRFWAIVERVIPEYKERREQLKDLQRKLCGEGWEG